MTKPFQVDGVDYTPPGIYMVRQEIIGMRDEALMQNAFTPAVLLTHVIALLEYLVETLEHKSKLHELCLAEECPGGPPCDRKKNHQGKHFWDQVSTEKEEPR